MAPYAALLLHPPLARAEDVGVIWVLQVPQPPAALA